MNLIKTVKAIFARPIQPTIPYDADAYIAKHMTEINVSADSFMKKYGTDFFNFLYRPHLDLFIRREVLPFKNPDSKHNHFLDNNYWLNKHPFNFPGPFYTGESDTCGTGDSEAPSNVMYDSYTSEYIFRQPQTFAEFLCVIDAANVEVFDSYSCDGNDHWTYQACKNWWSDKKQLLEELQKPEIRNVNGDRIKLYSDYLNGEAEIDLRRYCYFLENGTYPTNDTAKLPIL